MRELLGIRVSQYVRKSIEDEEESHMCLVADPVLGDGTGTDQAYMDGLAGHPWKVKSAWKPEFPAEIIYCRQSDDGAADAATAIARSSG